MGALVSANQADPLAVIQRLDPIYVDIQQSSADLHDAAARACNAAASTPDSTQVRLKLEDGSDYGYAGTVAVLRNLVNESTGTVTLRARFPNPQGLLLPGMFVQALFTQAVEPSVFLVPQQALQRDIGGDRPSCSSSGRATRPMRRKVVARPHLWHRLGRHRGPPARATR